MSTTRLTTPCPNCGQWRYVTHYAGGKPFADCGNDCMVRGFAPFEEPTPANTLPPLQDPPAS